MKPVPVLTNDYVITNSDCDFKSELRLSRLFDFFQDIASMHAENLGVSIESLHNDYGAAWVLIRMKVEIDKLPILHDMITVETWPQKARAIYVRDYVVKDSEGNIIVRAISNWVIMNIEKREIFKGKLVDYQEIENKKERSMDSKLIKPSPSSEPKSVYEKIIHYSDVDYNEHINNAKYVDYIMDCMTMEEHRTKQVKAIEVHYLSEAIPGETMMLNMGDSSTGENAVYIEGVAEEDERTVFTSTLQFE